MTAQCMTSITEHPIPPPNPLTSLLPPSPPYFPLSFPTPPLPPLSLPTPNNVHILCYLRIDGKKEGEVRREQFMYGMTDGEMTIHGHTGSFHQVVGET